MIPNDILLLVQPSLKKLQPGWEQIERLTHRHDTESWRLWNHSDLDGIFPSTPSPEGSQNSVEDEAEKL